MKELTERNIIVFKSHKRPYGVRLTFRTWTLGTLGNLDNVSILNKSGLNITLTSSEMAPWECGRLMKIEVNGFASATQAEISGKQLAVILFWHAIKNGHALMLTYQTPEPVYVYERNRSSGFDMFGYADVSVDQKKFIESLSTDYTKVPYDDPKLLLSMEIFAGSKLETSERAKFLSMINAFELLPDRKKQKPEVHNFINHVLNLLNKNEEIKNEIKHNLASSIGSLKKESITQSLKRYVFEILPDHKNAAKTIEAAYAIRSQIVHAGKPKDADEDIYDVMIRLESLMKSIYAKILNFDF